MPQINATGSIAAGGSASPFQGWAYETPNRNALLELMINGTSTGLTMNLTTGSESIVSIDTPVSAGGTAGVLPARLNNEPIVDMVEANQRIALVIRNPTAGAITYNLVGVLTYK